MSEETLKILEMVKSQKISVEDGEKLLETINKKSNSSETHPNKKFLRVRVLEGSDKKVNVNIPLALAEVGLRMIPEEKLKLNNQQISVNQLLDLIEAGTEGELVNIQAMEDGKETRINITID